MFKNQALFIVENIWQPLALTEIKSLWPPTLNLSTAWQQISTFKTSQPAAEFPFHTTQVSLCNYNS